MMWLILVAFYLFGRCVNSDGIIDNYDLKDDESRPEFDPGSGSSFPWNPKNLQGFKHQENFREGNNSGNGFNGRDNYRGYGDQTYRGRKRDGAYYDDKEKERLDNIFGYTGPTANDEPENLIRPCALDDWQCIRKYFASNSQCTPAYGPIPDPLTLDVNTVFFTAVNLTVNFANFMLRGLSSAKVIDFYVNKKSGNLVFAFDIQNMNLTSPRGYFRYRRTAKESIILVDRATVNFRTATFTAVIPRLPHLRLDLADIHVYIQDGNPIYFIGPGASNSTDPDVILASFQFGVLLPIIVRQGLLFESQLLTSIYIQKNVCDFGLKLVSV